MERGINYVDVAPTYGNAQERLGPALEPYREQSFLACKTTERTKEGSAKELEASLGKLRTDARLLEAPKLRRLALEAS